MTPDFARLLEEAETYEASLEAMSTQERELEEEHSRILDRHETYVIVASDDLVTQAEEILKENQ